MIDYSIIIPHYNDYEGISRLLKTIPDYENVEIIIIDDNSNIDINDIRELFNRYKYTKCKAIVNPNSFHSAGVCRNIGLFEAIGKWLIFIDSDDYFSENAFEIINEYKDSNYAFVVFKTYSVIMPGGMEGTRHKYYANLVERYIKEPNRNNFLNILYCWDPVVSKMFNRLKIVNNKINFEESIVANDVIFSARAAVISNENIRIDNRTIYVATTNKESLTTHISMERYKIRFNVWLKKYLFYRDTLPNEVFYKLNMKTLYYFYKPLTYGYFVLFFNIFVKYIQHGLFIDKIKNIYYRNIIK